MSNQIVVSENSQKGELTQEAIRIKIKNEIKFIEEIRQYFLCNFETGLIKRIKLYSNKGGAKIGGNIYSKDIKGYLRIKMKGKTIKAHRFIFYCYHGYLPELVDHKNTIKDDNRIKNLREITPSGNIQNQRKATSRNKVGLLGVTYKKGRYEAQIRVNKKSIYLGRFDTPKDAHEFYLISKKQLHSFSTI